MCKLAEVKEEDTIPTVVILAIIAGCVLLTAVLSKVVSKLSSNEIKSDFEKQLTPDEELQEACRTSIYEQRAWIVYEQLDGLSDVANGVLVLVEGSMSTAFTVLFGLVGIMSTFSCLNGLIKRSQILNTYNKIRTGDKQQ